VPEESNRKWPSGLSKRLKAVYALFVRRMRRFMEERPMSQKTNKKQEVIYEQSGFNR
jgi:hypothetical protein